nr:acyltransferase [uncultured Agrobacterium sp.]
MNFDGRNFNLDSMRALAAICVAYSHLILKVRQRGDADAFTDFMYWITKYALDVGKGAVLILFALSGFFIISSLRSAAKRFDRPAIAFIGQRFFRLYPLYWMSLLFGVLFPWDDPNQVFSAYVIAINATMFQGFLFVPNVVGLYWTLQIELTFYGMCVVLFLLNFHEDRRLNLIVTIGLFAVALLLAILRYLYEIKMPVALPLMVGVCFLGGLWRETDGGRSSHGHYAWMAVIAFYIFLVPISVLAYSRDTGFGETWFKYAISYGTAMFVFLVWSRARRSVLRWLAPVGSAGYAIFLFHPSIYAILDKSGFSPESTQLPVTVYMAISLLIVVILSLAIKRYVFDQTLAVGEILVAKVGGRRGKLLPQAASA